LLLFLWFFFSFKFAQIVQNGLNTKPKRFLLCSGRGKCTCTKIKSIEMVKNCNKNVHFIIFCVIFLKNYGFEQRKNKKFLNNHFSWKFSIKKHPFLFSCITAKPNPNFLFILKDHFPQFQMFCARLFFFHFYLFFWWKLIKNWRIFLIFSCPDMHIFLLNYEKSWKNRQGTPYGFWSIWDFFSNARTKWGFCDFRKIVIFYIFFTESITDYYVELWFHFSKKIAIFVFSMFETLLRARIESIPPYCRKIGIKIKILITKVNWIIKINERRANRNEVFSWK